MTGYVYVYRDITERKRAEEALRRVHDDLEAKVAERTRELAEANAVLHLENAERQRAEAIARLAKAQAERRAREAEEAQSMLKTILEHANEGITMAGGPPDFPIILNSKHANEMLGITPNTKLNFPAGWHGQVFGIWMNDGVTRPHPEQLPLYRAAHYGEVIENEEWIIERPDGSRINLLSNVAPIRDFAGHIIGAINCWRDISARVQAEKELKEREERFRATFEQAAVGIAHTALDGTWLQVNQRLCDIVGYTREELLQKMLQDLTYPDDLAIDLELASRLLAGEIATYAVEKRYLKKDSSLIWIILTVSLVRKMSGEPSYFIAVVEDISERKRAEENLRRSEAYLAEGQRLSHTCSVICNVVTGEVFWSQETYRIYGFDPMGPKPSSNTFFQIVHPEERRFVEQSFERIVRDRSDYVLDFRIIRPDGTIRSIHSVGHPLFNDAGDLTELIGTVMDVTERKQAEQARQQLLEQLVTAQEQERVRISRELHDSLGQSLTALHFGLKVVQERANCPPDMAEAIEKLRELALSIDDDLDRLTFELRPPALDDLGLEEALRLLVKKWTATSGIAVDLHTRSLGQQRLPATLETTLYRVVQEALTNIFKHAQATQVSLMVECRGGEVRAIIEDDGQGFDRTAMEERSGDEHRLGLKGMEERAALVNGRLHIETALGAGTTIYVHIPLPTRMNKGEVADRGPTR
jgi:PAS domain S-box-containing protein